MNEGPNSVNLMEVSSIPRRAGGGEVNEASLNQEDATTTVYDSSDNQERKSEREVKTQPTSKSWQVY